MGEKILCVIGVGEEVLCLAGVGGIAGVRGVGARPPKERPWRDWTGVGSGEGVANSRGREVKVYVKV